MVPWTLLADCRRWILALAATVGMALGAVADAQEENSPFQIVWVVIGEAASGADNGSAHAGRQLFMASDLMSRNLANIKVELERSRR